MDKRHVRTLQKEVNETLDNAQLDWMKVPVDGGLGPITLKAARIAGSWQGLSPTRLKKISNKHIDEAIFDILAHRKPATREMKKRHNERELHFAKLRELHRHPVVKEGWVEFDGHQVAGWMVEQALKPARDSGVWKGSVYSGFRDPVYSEHLCIVMCGAPTCPGRCGGKSSNHSGPPSFKGVKYEGAVDVTDAAGLRRWCNAHGNPIRGGGEVLPSDTPHFSRVGN